MICRRSRSIIQRCNELRGQEAELLGEVRKNVELESVLQDGTKEALNSGAYRAPDARFDVHQRSAFFDVQVCQPYADSYRDLTPKQTARQHEKDKKPQYTSGVRELERGTFTPLVFITTGGVAEECARFHGKLAELLSIKKGESYAATIA